MQGPVPEQPLPLQPLKVEPAAGAAVSVTAVPLVKLAEQVAPQVIPAGELVTVPLPVPAGVTVSVTAVPLVKLAEQVAPQVIPAGELVTVPLPVPAGVTVRVKVWSAKVAVTVVAALRVTVQGPLPEQPPPLQPLKVEPAAGVAVSVTAVPLVKLAEQVAPQVIPAGELVTVPLPVPTLL